MSEEMKDVGAVVDGFLNPYSLRTLYSALPTARDLVFEFFVLFSRTEHGLKAAGFRKREDGRAEPDWIGFAGKLACRLTQPTDARVRSAVCYLQDSPPGKQIVSGGRLDWEPRPCRDRQDARFVIESLTMVRNNLFHGGKELSGPATERDVKLIEHSLVLLAYCIDQVPEVKDAMFKDVPPRQPNL